MLEQVQIAPTVVDLIMVDELRRLPTGRPYVTVVIDVFSRSVVGLVIILEAPWCTCPCRGGPQSIGEDSQAGLVVSVGIPVTGCVSICRAIA